MRLITWNIQAADFGILGERHNRIVALRRVGNSGSRGPSAECCATWSDGAATSKDYGARLGNAATGIFATLRQKSMAQLAFEELEERILLRSDLGQDQVGENGVEIPA